MMPTTVPAMLIAFAIYLVAGFTLIDADGASFERIDAITSALQANFLISPWLLVPALLVIVLAVKRMPPIPSLFAGVLAGGAAAMIAQGRSEEHTSELQSLMRISYAVFCLKKKIQHKDNKHDRTRTKI